MRILVSACLAACALHAQPAGLQSPVSGFVFDGSSKTLRQIQGIPGAALIGAGVDFGMPVTAAAVSPKMDSAIVLSADGTPHIFVLRAASAVEATPAGLLAAQRIIFSPSGTAAALYARGSVQVVRGLPGSATLGFEIRLQLHQKTRVAAANESLAISDDGAYLLHATGGPVELIGLAGDSRKLMDAAPGALAVFAPESHDAAVIHSGKLTIFRDVIGDATRGVTCPARSRLRQ